MKFILKKIENLRRQLSRWQYMYYVKNCSEISDEEYDIYLEELRHLELSYLNASSSYNSPTQCVGSTPQIGFRQIYHQTPMLSLNSIINRSQLLLFDKRVRKILYSDTQIIKYCCELKLDGIAISLLYKNGKLIQAGTRGNGNIGEDVTENARTIESIPNCLIDNNNNFIRKFPYFLEVRGEVFILKERFLKLNHTLLNQGKKIFSNSRNAASGSLRQLNPNITASRPLSFYCYGISNYIGKEILPNSHNRRLLLCKDWGIPINNHMLLVKDIDSAAKFFDDIKKIRSNLELDIDGVVIKVDNCIYQNKLHHSLKAPNWAIAYKFPAESKFAQLNKVKFRVGRTGLITPIAYITPITINNVTIKKVNIHNINEIKRLNLMIGDTIRVQRSGDVIPKITEVILSKRFNYSKIIELPLVCPACGSILKPYKYKSSVLCCPAKLMCLAQRKAALEHFVSRKAMNIRGMGSKIISQLINKNLVSTPSDLFYLHKEKLIQLDGLGMQSAEKLLQSINLSKQITLSSFIYALGIPNVGLTASKNLAIIYKNIENLIDADLQSLLKLESIGMVVATDIYQFFRNSDNLKSVHDLIHPDVGIQWISVN